MSKYDVVSYDETHGKIVTALVGEFISKYIVGQGLIVMNESKAYKQKGFASFEEYTWETLKMKKSQAYSYMKVAKKYSEEFLQLNGSIGVTKLELLAKLPEAEVKNFIEMHNVESMSVKEVKKTLESYQNKKVEDPAGSEESTIEIIRESIPVDSFGSFIKSKRLSKGYSLVNMAIKLNMPWQTYQHVESGYRGLLGKKQNFYDGLIQVLELSADEIKKMYMWADQDCIRRKKLAPDLVEYATANPLINDILRAAKESKASSSKLQNILKQLQAV